MIVVFFVCFVVISSDTARRSITTKHTKYPARPFRLRRTTKSEQRMKTRQKLREDETSDRKIGDRKIRLIFLSLIFLSFPFRNSGRSWPRLQVRISSRRAKKSADDNVVVQIGEFPVPTGLSGFVTSSASVVSRFPTTIWERRSSRQASAPRVKPRTD
jgi:hypothetical protein